MKKILHLFVALCFSHAAFASTSISTPNVSGHWTLSGSPYMVYNDIQVASNTLLIIDPGVEVVFYGSYRFLVYGVLQEKGSSTLPINFHVNDTTGWGANPTKQGGWHGIQLKPYSGSSSDTSVFEYCDISYTKFDSADWYGPVSLGAFRLERPLTIKNCNFAYNKTVKTALPLIQGYMPASGGTCKFDGCTFHNNVAFKDVLNVNNFYGGNSVITGCDFYANLGGAVIYANLTHLLFENNKLHDNNGVPIWMEGYDGLVRGNKVYNNINDRVGAVYATGGFFDIVGNIICNNQEVTSSCGAIEGGGGINLSLNGAISGANTAYTVRNNIIANNYSPFHGGGINVFNAKSSITNNHIINNTSNAGAAIYVQEDSMLIVVKNNVFYGNVFTGSLLPCGNVIGIASSLVSIQYENNWSEHSNNKFDINIASSSGYTIVGDTTTNVLGTSPNLVAPTLTASVTDMAIAADFNILSTSACVNAGDTAGTHVDTVDYGCHARIVGSRIDIGAFEYNATTNSPIVHNAKSLELFPNPNTGKFSVNLTSGVDEQATIIITDLLGKEIQNLSITTNAQTSLDLNLPSGMYIISAFTNNYRTTAKMIVSNH